MADVKVTVGLGRKARMDALMLPTRQILLDDLADEIRA
jgi:hypothetical protein